MAEVVGITSGLLALAVAGYKASKSLHEAVSNLQSRRKTIRDIRNDSTSLVAVLETIEERIRGSSDLERLEPLRQPLDCCTTTCQEMLEMLDACTVHSTDDRNHVRDWLNMRFHGKGFEDIKQRLCSYKSTLDITFGLIMMRDQSSTQTSLEELKASIIGTKEDLEEQLVQVQQSINTAETSLRGALQADRARLQRSLETLAEAQKLTDSIIPDIVIQGNRAGESSRAIFGTDTSQPQFRLTVSDNEAQAHAVMGNGVYTPQTLQALLEKSTTAEVARAFQALQHQTQITDVNALQSIANQIVAGRNEGTPTRASPPPALMDLDRAEDS